jgi:vancomycin resistance protein VanW
MTLHQAARSLLPFPVRAELLRLRRLPGWLLESHSIAHDRRDAANFRHQLSTYRSPLRRQVAVYDEKLQIGKERNVALAASMLNGLVIQPYQIFSYHHAVGRTTRLRGFRMGLELHAGQQSKGVGGGCCQVSNMLYVLAVFGGMRIVERHRHGFDMFPDERRTVPFACGATVFYNYADFRFENPLTQPVMISIGIQDGYLVGELRAVEDPGWNAEVYETEHGYHKTDDGWIRENRIRRRFIRPDGRILLDQEVSHNVAKVLYDPPGDVT